MMAYVKRLFKYIAYFILVVLVSLSLYTFVMTDILKKDYVDVFGYTYFVVKTGSMSGTLEVDDVIFVKIGDSPKIGDIVSYKSEEGEIVTHRLVRKLGDKLITQGDVNNSTDKPISSDMVIGVVKGSMSPRFLLKCIAVFLIVFIFLSLINFDVVVRKFIFKDKKIVDVDNDILEEETSFSVKISVDEINRLKGSDELESINEVHEDVEVLDFEEVTKIDDGILASQKELVEQIINLLRVKNGDREVIKINKEWILKYQFIYRMAVILIADDINGLMSCINHPGFRELYDYDLEQVGLYENLRNKIYDMPIYVFLKILIYSIFYNDDKFFDGVYKIMKYKVSVDKNNYFNLVEDKYGSSQLQLLINFMMDISIKFGGKDIFELERIEKDVLVNKYINE